MNINQIKAKLLGRGNSATSGIVKEQYPVGDTSIDTYNNGTNLTIYNATGGKVIQIRKFNEHTERTDSHLYIIPEDTNFGDELSQIILRDSLTK